MAGMSSRSANKTRKTAADPADYIAAIADDGRRTDCATVAEIMAGVTGADAKMWGASMVGFGEYHYRYESGREGDFFETGFANRASALTIYVMAELDGYDGILERLGKFKTGKSCLYVKRLADIDVAVLRELLEASVAAIRERYPRG